MKFFNKQLKRIILGVLIITFLQASILAARTPKNPIAPPNTDSPRATLTEFIDNMNEAYTLIMNAHNQSKQEGGFRHSPSVQTTAYNAQQAFERAIKTLNLSEIPVVIRNDVGAESALMLKEILDRLDLPPLNTIPDQAEVIATKLKIWEIPETQIQLQQVEEGFRSGEFLFSVGTVERLRTFYNEMKTLPYKTQTSPGFYHFYIGTPGHLLPPKWIHWLPAWTTFMYGGQTIWQWFSLVGSTLLIIAILYAIRRILRQEQVDQHRVKEAWLGLVFPLLCLMILGYWAFWVDDIINLTGEILKSFLKTITILEAILLSWLTFMTLNAIGRTIIASPHFQTQPLESIIVRNGFRLLGFVTAATVLYYGSDAIGIAVGPLIASLGVSSVAIGFGMRHYVENIVGGITLFANRPMEIGDFCELGGTIGTIEDIGLRATLIRTPDRKLITVPNSVVSTSQIVNHSRRDKYAFNRTLNLKYESTREQLAPIMDSLRNMLIKQPQLTEARVSLVGLNDKTIDVELFAYVLTQNMTEYLAIQEQLLMKIENILSQNQSDLKT